MQVLHYSFTPASLPPSSSSSSSLFLPSSLSYLHRTSLYIKHSLHYCSLLLPAFISFHILPFLFSFLPLFFLYGWLNAFTPPLHSCGCFIHQSQYYSTNPLASQFAPPYLPLHRPPPPPQHMVHPWRPIHSQLLPSSPSRLASVGLTLAPFFGALGLQGTHEP